MEETAWVIFLLPFQIIFACATFFVVLNKPVEFGMVVPCGITLVIFFLILIRMGFRKRSQAGGYSYAALLCLGTAAIPLLSLVFLIIGITISTIETSTMACLARIAPGASLKYCNLREQDLRGVDLHGADLSYTNLQGSDLTGANLTGVSLDNANLEEVIGLTDNNLAQILGVSEDNLPVALSRKRIRLESVGSILTALKDVCMRKPVTRVGIYTPDIHFHPVVILSQGKKYISTPDEWQPMALRFTELVVCIDDEFEEFLTTCNYVGGSPAKLYGYYTNASLVIAGTGEEIARTKITGRSDCPKTLPKRQTQAHGEQVRFDDMKGWLERFVNPPLNDEIDLAK